MNEQLFKFIELCLIDGVITDKEREVIFRKSIELKVPIDECEIILEGMIFKYNKENNKFLASDITYDPVRHDTYLYIDDGVSEEEFISEKKATNEHERLKIYNAFVKEQKEKTPLERKEDRIRYDRIRWMKNQNMSREQIKTELERIEKEDARKKQTTTAKGGNLRKTKKRNSL